MSIKTRIRHITYMIFAGMVLSSCVADRLKFWDKETSLAQPVAYTLTGFDKEQTDLNDDISALITSKLIVEDLKEGESVDEPLALYQARAIEPDILKVMYSKGYYKAKLEMEAQSDEQGAPRVTFNVVPGERAIISSVSIVPPVYLDYLKEVNVKVGDPLKAQNVLSAQASLYKAIQKQSCAFDLNVTHQVVLDKDMRHAEVLFKVQQGKPAKFGELSYSGNDTVKAAYLDKLIDWDEGECFKKDYLETVRARLLSSELFSRADPIFPEKAAKMDIVPVTMALKERPPRTISAGVSYYTDEEFGLSLGWEHRNFFGNGEKFNADLSLSMLEQTLETTLTKPFFMRKDQNLSLNAALSREDTDAYESIEQDLGFSVNRDITKTLSAKAGAQVVLTHIKEETGQSDNYALLKPQASVTYDSRDDALDPHKGVVLKLSAEPTVDLLGTTDPYLTTQGSAQGYYELHKKLVIAGRAKLGTIIGASSGDIPASELFYAGGGGSVRGFGYQEIGPFLDGDPVGGRSLFETSLELRYKITDKIGAVAFVDAGQVDDEVTPAFGDMAIGAGAGMRYYTDFGPLRVDVGVPLRGDENCDQNFQVYISIGQAF